MARPAGKGFFSVKKCGRHLDMHPIYAIMDIKILPGAMMAKREGKKGKRLEYDPVLFDQDVEAYRAYWESIRDKIPQKFAKAYWGTKFSDCSHFHDNDILQFSIMGNYNTYKYSADTIEMLICGGGIGLYGFTFSKIHKIYCRFDERKYEACEHLLIDIGQSWIGISEEGNYIFEFITHEGGRCRIDFEEVQVIERSLQSWLFERESEK